MIDYKLIAAGVAAVCTAASYPPYYRDIFKGRTKPHLYTWLIWTLTTGTAAAGMLIGGAGVVSWVTIFATLAIFSVFLLSFKYGTKNITLTDGFILAGALIGIVIWWQLKDPLLAVIVATLIDGAGYVPTYRKLWTEPWSEDVFAWTLYIIGPGLVLVSLNQYNLLTVTYTAMTFIANIILVAESLIRRRVVQKPAQNA